LEGLKVVNVQLLS